MPYPADQRRAAHASMRRRRSAASVPHGSRLGGERHAHADDKCSTGNHWCCLSGGDARCEALRRTRRGPHGGQRDVPLKTRAGNAIRTWNGDHFLAARVSTGARSSWYDVRRISMQSALRPWATREGVTVIWSCWLRAGDQRQRRAVL